MPRLPDRFDLWVRKARQNPDPERQIDYVLGALAGLPDWHFLNAGSRERPRPADADIDGLRQLLLFSDPGRIQELMDGSDASEPRLPPSVISIPTAAAMTWCLEQRALGIEGLLVNPGEDGVIIPMDQLAAYHADWSQRGGRLTSGFWIPNLTSEEEDFWQQNGL